MDLTPDGVFARYEEIRARLPSMPAVRDTRRAAGLAGVADEFDVFLFDAFGVLNVGDTVIPGAPDIIAHLRTRGKDVCVVTNAATQDGAALLRKFSGMGFDFSPSEIISSRAILTGSLDFFATGEWAAILPEGGSREGLPRGTHSRDRDADAFWNADGYLFLSSKEWDEEHQERLIARLKRRSCPVLIGNPDLVAPREYGLSREPGYFAHDILDRTLCPVQFFGKPFANVFDAAAAEVLARRGGLDRNRMVMVGDTLHTDILGGAAAGMKTVLVTDHGLFKGGDAAAFVEASGIRPDFIIPSI